MCRYARFLHTVYTHRYSTYLVYYFHTYFHKAALEDRQGGDFYAIVTDEKPGTGRLKG